MSYSCQKIVYLCSGYIVSCFINLKKKILNKTSLFVSNLMKFVLENFFGARPLKPAYFKIFNQHLRIQIYFS